MAPASISDALNELATRFSDNSARPSTSVRGACTTV
jgi:hypothetical protein